MKEMKIKILPTGEIKILDIKGVHGQECLEFTKFIENSLGDVTHREFTEDYYRENYNNEKEIEKQF
jgi:hypothetical protein